MSVGATAPHSFSRLDRRLRPAHLPPATARHPPPARRHSTDHGGALLHRMCHGGAWQEETLVRRLVDYEAHIEPVVRSLTESSWVQTVEASGAWADVLSKVQQALAAIPGYQ